MDKATGKKGMKLVPPVTTGHADYVNPFEFLMFLSRAQGLDFDVMLEAKGKDLASVPSSVRPFALRGFGGFAVRAGSAGGGGVTAPCPDGLGGVVWTPKRPPRNSPWRALRG